MARIALIEDDPQVRLLLARVIASGGYEPEVFSSGDDFLAAHAPASFEVVVTDLKMEGASGLDVLKACRAEEDPPDVLLVTGYGSIRTAVEAIRLGAFDYLPKPVDPTELLHRVAQAIEARRLKREVNALSGEVRRRHEPAPPIAESPIMQEFLSRARKAAVSSSTVLILGETGTGKNVIAHHIQSTGQRADRAYLTLNCAALPEALLESELFGHARGAFAGAHTFKRGLFEEANGGTLFLDDVGAMSLAAQARLLHVVEDGVVRRVGETHPIRVDVRILAATNRDLKAAVQSGEFREDLYYRVSVVTLLVPPLRERPEDIEPLAGHFLADAVQRLGKLRVFAPETLDFLRGYAFPGNVRELRNAIEQAVILSEDGGIYPSDFAFSREQLDRAGATGKSRRRRSEPISETISPERLSATLQEHRGNRVRAARALQISRATLYRLLARSRPISEKDSTDPS